MHECCSQIVKAELGRSIVPWKYFDKTLSAKSQSWYVIHKRICQSRYDFWWVRLVPVAVLLSLPWERINDQRGPHFSVTWNSENYSTVIAAALWTQCYQWEIKSWDLYSPGFMIYPSITSKLHEIISVIAQISLGHSKPQSTKSPLA